MSNPPVHLGLTDDFRVVRLLARGAPAALRPGGSLWVVAQAFVPVGSLIEGAMAAATAKATADTAEVGVASASQSASASSSASFERVDLWHSDGRFAVWRAVVAGGLEPS